MKAWSCSDDHIGKYRAGRHLSKLSGTFTKPFCAEERRCCHSWQDFLSTLGLGGGFGRTKTSGACRAP